MIAYHGAGSEVGVSLVRLSPSVGWTRDSRAPLSTPRVGEDLGAARHPRYHLHFTPTSASWLNQVERWFARLADQHIKRAVHHSIGDLKADIAEFINVLNDDPKPFIWTKDG